jgi:subtilisin family serine protease
MSPRRIRFPWLRILIWAACLGMIVSLGAYGQKPKDSVNGVPGAPGQVKKGAPPGQANHEKFAPDQVLVRFRKGTPGSVVAAAHRAMGAHVLQTYSTIEGLQLVHIPPSMRVEDALEKYGKNRDVLYVEPDYSVHTVLTPNDPSFGDQWALNNTGQSGGTPDADIDAPEAWDYTTGSSEVVVAVIDSGVDYNHPDLAANIWSNSLDCNTNGVDDDGDGYIDDCHGIDTFNHDSDPFDDLGHGTHVSGIIGAVGSNSVGVTGVNWNVSIMACKFISAGDVGYDSGMIECLNYIAWMKDHGVNIVATNNSYGGSPFSQATLDAIEENRKRGILFFAAAGNNGTNNDTVPFYPSNYNASNVIAVAATNRADAWPSFSDLGRRTVHLGAPGASILSTYPSNSYAIADGTSMATPFVTGVAALLKAYDPSLDWKEIKNRILAGGDNKTSMTNTITQKRLNAYGALTCSNSIVLSRLRPIGSTVYGQVGTPLMLSALHINCAAPNGRLRVSVAPAGVTVDLLDDGHGLDEEADDGIYTGQFTPYATGTYNLTFPGSDVVTLNVAPMHPYEFETVLYTYTTITGTSLGLSGDSSTATIIPPFPIPFGGGSYDNVYVGADGVISFSNAYTYWYNYAIPTTNVQTLVAPFWDDLVPISGGNHNVFWDVVGSAPSRQLVIEWRDVPCFICSSTESAKFQVIFYEDKSDILFNYADVYFSSFASSYNNGLSATVGVQISTTSGRQYSYNTASLSDSSSIRWWTRSAKVTPTSLDFGQALVGNSAGPLPVTVTNNGGAALTISSIDISGGSAGEFSKSSTCPLSPSTLASGADCTINVTFNPTVGGPRRATLSVSHDAPGSPNRVALSGLGAALGLSTDSLTFSPRTVGNSSAPQTITVTNHGTSPVSIFDLEVTGVNGSDFAPSGDCPVAPATLAGSATCSINVVFTPGGVGARSALLLMSHDGGASPAAVTLAGTGQ